MPTRTITPESQLPNSTDLFPPADLVRTSDDRERRLTEYVRAHTGADISVCLASTVETAFVAPTTEEALVETEQTGLSRDHAHRLVEQIDADYLVVISTRPACLDHLPIDDQLTADRAQQFGLALHELGHIRYTAITEIATLLDQAVDESYQKFVHGLWNLCEDAAIEHQLTIDRSQIAADRLALLNRSLSPHVADLPDDAERQYTFRDAVETALYDQGIYETGRLAALCDPDDSRLIFHSDADKQAYELVADDLRQLLTDVLSIPESVARAKRVLECWQTVLKPLVDVAPDQSAEQESTPSGGATTSDDASIVGDESVTTNQTPGDEPSSSEADTSDRASETGNGNDGMSGPGASDQPVDIPTQPSPTDINTDRTQDVSYANALDYPAIGDPDTADALAPPDQSQSSTGDPANENGPEDEARESASIASPTDRTASDDPESTDSPSHHTPIPDDAATESAEVGDTSVDVRRDEPEASDTDGEPAETPTATTEPSSQSPDPWGSNQTTLDAFVDTVPNATDQSDSSNDTVSASSTATDQDTDHDRAHETADDGASTDEQAKRDRTDSTGATAATGSDTDDKSPLARTAADPTAAHQSGVGTETDADASTEPVDASHASQAAPSPTPAHAAEQLKGDDVLAADEQAAHEEADRATPDQTALDHDLTDVAAALDQLEGGTGATPGSLEELELMPNHESRTEPQRWQAATGSAPFVGETLQKALRESRRDGFRTGLTSGTFDRRRVGALARGHVTVFKQCRPGEQKDYDLVFVLDRSASMQSQITIAENALVRFALACEAIGISVAVIDFVDSQARLVKPFSVESEYVQGSLMTGETGGDTPLADALGFARELLERRQSHPLILVVTDGKPSDSEAYHDELAACYAPVCGLTLVLGRSPEQIPAWVADNEQFYDRHVYVHEPDRLDERLDQFAVMFDGL